MVSKVTRLNPIGLSPMEYIKHVVYNETIPDLWTLNMASY